MPYRVRKRKGAKKPYKIQVRRAGSWRTVGASTSKQKAKASAGVRLRAEREKRAR